MQPRAAIYCRVSTDEQEANTSLQSQREAGLRKAESLGAIVPEGCLIIDVASGAKDGKRKGYQHLKRLVQQKAVDYVIARKPDRLARTAHSAMTFLRFARDHGVRVVWTDQEFADSPAGRAMEGVLFVFAEFEHATISERMVDGTKARVTNLKRPIPGVRAPFGYEWVNAEKTRLRQHPQNGPFWRGILLELAAGVSGNSIAERLNRTGVPTPSGKPGARWQSSNITTMAKNPIYYGVWEVGRVAARQSQNYREQESIKPIWGENTIRLDGIVEDPIIDEATWRAIQARMVQSKTEAARNNPDPERSLLRAGFVKCGYCGHNAVAARQKMRDGHHLYYKCNWVHQKAHGCKSYYIRVEELDEVVWAFVRRLLADPELLRQQIEAHRETNPEADEIARYEAHERFLQEQIDNLLQNLKTSTVPAVAAIVEAEIAKLLDQKQETQGVIAQLQQKNLAWENRQAALDDMVTTMRKFNRRLEKDAPYNAKRAALQMLGVEVRLFNAKDNPERWEISYGFIGQEPKVVSASDVASTLTESDEFDSIDIAIRSDSSRDCRRSGRGAVKAWSCARASAPMR